MIVPIVADVMPFSGTELLVGAVTSLFMLVAGGYGLYRLWKYTNRDPFA